jgi:hypothetical protein
MDQTRNPEPAARKWACALFVAALMVTGTVSAQTQEPAQPPIVRPAGQNTITIRGFVNAVAFVQDASFGFGNGGNAAWVTNAPETNQWIVSADVRASRLALDFRGPPIGGGWSANGTLEMDFFGGFTGAGPTADEQPVPRLRTAFADLTRGGTTLRVGQFWNPLFGYVPATVAQLAFPPGIGSAGLPGWRFPGIFLYQNLTDAQAPIRAQLQLAALRGSWDGPGANVDHLSAGETSGFPQVEGRIDLVGRTAGGTQWGAFVVAHYDQKDLRPYGTAAAPAGQPEKLDGSAVAAGLRVVPGPLTLHGNFYTGRAIGHTLGNITQFGDIQGWGGWAQAGFAFSPSWSTWLFYGIDNPDSDDVRATIPAPADQPGLRLRQARTQNQRLTALLRYASGPYQIGLEWMRAETDWSMRTFGAEGFQDQTRAGSQFALGVVYLF